MQNKRSMYDIRNALQQEISSALNESFAEIEISETTANDSYEVKGKFKVTPFLSSTIKRKGKFEAELDENLKIVTLKITEDQQ
jgi:hypothetical protein